MLSENLLAALGAVIGEPYSISHEGLELVNNLAPHKHTRHEYRGLRSEVELDFHIENAAQAFMPEGDASPPARRQHNRKSSGVDAGIAAPQVVVRYPKCRSLDSALRISHLVIA